MKIASLKRTSAEKKAQEEKYKASPCNTIGGDDYGYGLTINLDKSALEKLDLKTSSFDVDDEVTFEGRGVIMAVRSDKSNSYDSSTVEIQIRALGVEAGSATDAVDRALAKAGK